MIDNAAGYPILSLIAYLRLAGALVLLFTSTKNVGFTKWFANMLAFADMILSFFLIPRFNAGTADMQFVEKSDWIPTIGVRYHLGIDGISLLLILLTTILGILSILSSWTAIGERVKEYYIFMLLLQTGMIGVFVSLDFFLFYVFWEGFFKRDRQSNEAAMKYFLLGTFASGILLYGMALVYGPTGSTNLYEIAGKLTSSGPNHGLVLLGMLMLIAGLGFKVAAVPLHMWAPDIYQGAPTPVTGFLSVGPKAAYFSILIRICLVGLAPLVLALILAVSATMAFGLYPAPLIDAARASALLIR